ncbi:hypothetical protein CJO71_20070 [Burkholderia ubonensis]|uniref:Uncharacterized protein n=1 Tax=Burkholderia ubonensis TaxID=101571 RepID=A0AB74D3S9_9BURK|nr:hypothetical protein CJO71_20070 [Burkholderia ubonensis]PAJ98585.1 hypothetical protein CJO68_24140 [Burkholderia ubonensis]RQP69988.1 hypothetical protein DF015_31025 [Burkholderia ubonensis]RQP84646.1 hypothetical protein DF012_33935 [Burkholderia ubonensis]
MHLYLLSSGALAAGLSSLILVVVMGIQYVAMPYFGASVLLQWGALDSVWFVINAVLTAHFLYRTVEFLRPDVQLDVVRRYLREHRYFWRERLSTESIFRNLPTTRMLRRHAVRVVTTMRSWTYTSNFRGEFR